MRYESWCSENLAKTRLRGVQLYAECPWCGRSGGGFAVNVESGAFNCFKCSDREPSSGRSIAWLIRKVLQCSIQEAQEIADKNSFVPSWQRETITKHAQRIALSLPVSVKVFDEDRQPQWQIPKFIKKRGLTRETAKAFDLRTATEGPYRRRVIIPIRSIFGQSFTARAIDPSEELRYKNPPSAGHSKLVFGWEQLLSIVRTVVICEGPFDAMMLYQLGYAPLALLGKSMSDEQELTIRSLPQWVDIVIMLDPEERKSACEIAMRLADERKVSVSILPKGTDPGDGRADEISAALHSRIEWSGRTSKVAIYTYKNS